MVKDKLVSGSLEYQSDPAEAMVLGQARAEEKREWAGLAGRAAPLRPRSWEAGKVASASLF